MKRLHENQTKTSVTQTAKAEFPEAPMGAVSVCRSSEPCLRWKVGQQENEARCPDWSKGKRCVLARSEKDRTRHLASDGGMNLNVTRAD